MMMVTGTTRYIKDEGGNSWVKSLSFWIEPTQGDEKIGRETWQGVITTPEQQVAWGIARGCDPDTSSRGLGIHGGGNSYCHPWSSSVENRKVSDEEMIMWSFSVSFMMWWIRFFGVVLGGGLLGSFAFERLLLHMGRLLKGEKMLQMRLERMRFKVVVRT